MRPLPRLVPVLLAITLLTPTALAALRLTPLVSLSDELPLAPELGRTESVTGARVKGGFISASDGSDAIVVVHGRTD